MEMWMEGVRARGDIAEFSTSDPKQFGDVCITWGPRTVEKAHQKAIHHLVMECGFLGDRLDNFFVGWSGLNGMGRCPVPRRKNAGEEWYRMVKPLPKRKEHVNVAIFGQVAKDASLIPLRADDDMRPAAYKLWLAKVADHFANMNMAVGFRGHPSDPAWTNMVRPDVFSFDEGGWDKDRILGWAHLAFAFSSNALVEAYMAGVDVLPAHPTSLCWDIRSQPGRQNWQSVGKRLEWLDFVASNQWSSAQIKSGEAWEAIRDNMHRSVRPFA